MNKETIISAILWVKQRKKDTGLIHQVIMTKGNFQIIVDHTYIIQARSIKLGRNDL